MIEVYRKTHPTRREAADAVHAIMEDLARAHVHVTIEYRRASDEGDATIAIVEGLFASPRMVAEQLSLAARKAA